MLKLKKNYMTKYTISKAKRQLKKLGGGEISATYATNKGLIPLLHKEFLKIEV